MFKLLASVQKHILESHELGTQVTLETVEKLICGLTAIDSIGYVGFDAPKTNPIWGGFQRWSRQPSVYASFETYVEIRYARHLDENWYRFVVCKELCHALEASVGAHVNNEASADNLVNSFSLLSNADDLPNLPSMDVELLAEAAAIELLCPLPWRKQILAGGKIDEQVISTVYGIPDAYVTHMFRPGVMKGTEWLLNNG